MKRALFGIVVVTLSAIGATMFLTGWFWQLPEWLSLIVTTPCMLTWLILFGALFDAATNHRTLVGPILVDKQGGIHFGFYLEDRK